MGSQSKKHHYVPKLLLRGFASGKGKVWTRARSLSGAGFAQATANAAAENHYNTVSANGAAPDEVESLFANLIEGPAAEPLHRLEHDGVWFTEEERWLIARFLALQFLRSPGQRLAMDASAELLARLVVAAEGPEGVRRALAADLGREPTAEEVTEGWKAVSDFDLWQVKRQNERYLSVALEVLDDVATVFFRAYWWGSARFERRRLLTSDCGMVLVRHSEAPGRNGTGTHTADHVHMPLSRTTSLVLCHKAIDDRVHGFRLRTSTSRAREMNQRMVVGSQAWVYHHPDDDLEHLVGRGFHPGSAEGEDDGPHLAHILVAYHDVQRPVRLSQTPSKPASITARTGGGDGPGV